MQKLITIFPVLMWVFLSPACLNDDGLQHETVAYYPDTEWRIATPESRGMDSGPLTEMVEYIHSADIAVDSVHVIRNGYLLLDAYVYPFGPDKRHVIHSCTKSIMSALIGIAIEEGKISGIKRRVLEFFPDREVAEPSKWKKTITLEHLLTMTTGLESKDSYLYRWQGLGLMRASPDWVQYILDLPSEAPPGERFDYSNMASFLLSAIITETSGKSAEEYARERLFVPLGISDYFWPQSPKGITLGWGELRLKPLDLARFGYLFLRNGIWDGRQLVPEKWVTESTTEKIEAGTLAMHYGYQWWIDDRGVFRALGYAGQYLLVSREQDLVVVFTGALEENDFFIPEQLFRDYIVHAVRSDEALPEEGEAETRLREAVHLLGSAPDPDEPVREALESEVSEVLWILDQNPHDMWGITLAFDDEHARVKELYPMRADEMEIGLDGRYIINDIGLPEPVAVRGAWSGENTFVIEYRSVGGAWYTEAAVIFEEEEITLVISGSQGALRTVIHGNAS